MSGKDDDAGKEVPGTSRKTPLLGARGIKYKTPDKTKLMKNSSNCRIPCHLRLTYCFQFFAKFQLFLMPQTS